jgi:lipid A 3-O-deacylase
MKSFPIAAAAAAAALAAAPAQAQEIFGGIYAHDVNWVTRSGLESGVDLQLGWRGGKILPMLGGPRPHVLVSVNSAGDTHFAAAGVSWRLGNPLYVRPGIGLAVHTGPSRFDPTGRRIWFGSRVLFEPEIGIGYRISPRLSAEASWVHLSHAKLFNGQNPGLDTVGVRLNYQLR